MFEAIFGGVPLIIRFAIIGGFLILVLVLVIVVAKRLLTNYFPALRQKDDPVLRTRIADTPSFGRYPALRSSASMLRFFGGLAFIAGILILAYAFTMSRDYGFNIVFISILVSAGTFCLMSGLWFTAFGELIKVFVDIALNTEPLTNIAEDTHWFYERLSASTQANQPSAPRADPRYQADR